MALDPEAIQERAQALVGETLGGRYRLDAVLGIGAMGAVFKAYHTGLEREVAVKLLHRDLMASEEMRARFSREASAISKLDHPNCVRVTDFGSDDDYQYLVMELLEGSALTDELTEPLPPLRALELTDQVLAGLQHAHGHGLVHRDIKPDNIFLARDDGGTKAKLLDFGIVKLQEAEGQRQLTQVGMVFGTPHFMSPEQAMGSDVDARTDLYATGIVLYAMLTGVLPFESDDPVKVLRQQIHDDPPPLPSSVPEVIEKIVKRLMAKKPSERYESAAAVREDVAKAQALLDPPLIESPSIPRMPAKAGGKLPTLPKMPSVPRTPPREAPSVPRVPPRVGGTAKQGSSTLVDGQGKVPGRAAPKVPAPAPVPDKPATASVPPRLPPLPGRPSSPRPAPVVSSTPSAPGGSSVPSVPATPVSRTPAPPPPAAETPDAPATPDLSDIPSFTGADAALAETPLADIAVVEAESSAETSGPQQAAEAAAPAAKPSEAEAAPTLPEKPEGQSPTQGAGIVVPTRGASRWPPSWWPPSWWPPTKIQWGVAGGVAVLLIVIIVVATGGDDPASPDSEDTPAASEDQPPKGEAKGEGDDGGDDEAPEVVVDDEGGEPGGGGGARTLQASLAGVDAVIERRDYQSARLLLEELVKAHPEESELHWRMAQVLTELGGVENREAALRSYAAAIAVDRARLDDETFMSGLAALMEDPKLRAPAVELAIDHLGTAADDTLLQWLNVQSRPLDYHSRHRIMAHLLEHERGNEINRPLQRALDLWQSHELDASCEAFGKALEEANQHRDSFLLGSLRAVDVPTTGAAEGEEPPPCPGQTEKLETLRAEYDAMYAGLDPTVPRAYRKRRKKR